MTDSVYANLISPLKLRFRKAVPRKRVRLLRSNLKTTSYLSITTIWLTTSNVRVASSLACIPLRIRSPSYVPRWASGGRLLGTYEYNLLQFFVCFAALHSQDAEDLRATSSPTHRILTKAKRMRYSSACPNWGRYRTFHKHDSSLRRHSQRGPLIGFHGVIFHYPKPDQKQVLDNFDLYHLHTDG